MDRQFSQGRAACGVAGNGRPPQARRVALAATLAVLLLSTLPAARGAGAAGGEVDARAAVPAMKSVDVHGGKVELPPLRPVIDEAAKASARAAVTAARAAPATEAAAPAPAYALAAGRFRTPAEADGMLATLRAAVAEAAPRRGLRVDAMRSGDDWRAVCWPFSRREDALRLRDRLAARGQRIEVIAF
jgi:hypothetical protein